jgi:hypothetical protein
VSLKINEPEVVHMRRDYVWITSVYKSSFLGKFGLTLVLITICICKTLVCGVGGWVKYYVLEVIE